MKRVAKNSDKMERVHSCESQRLAPVSLYPASLDEAVAAFMQVDPQKVDERLKKRGVKKDKKK